MEDPVYEKLNVASVYIENRLEAEKLCAYATYELLATPKDVYHISFYNEACEIREQLTVYCVEFILNSKKKDVSKLYVGGKRILDYGSVVVESFDQTQIQRYTEEIEVSALTIKTHFDSIEEEYRFVASLAKASKLEGDFKNYGVHYAPSAFSKNNHSYLTIYTNRQETKKLQNTLRFYGELSTRSEKQIVHSYYKNDQLLYHQIESLALSNL